MPIQHSTYFNGSVQSVASQRNGRKFSVGIATTGTYYFGTNAAPERNTVISGVFQVRIQGATEWLTYPAGTKFEVPAHSGFDVRTDCDSAFYCEYL
jgi:purine/pyrimidine-nucleoside phosphorylase